MSYSKEFLKKILNKYLSMNNLSFLLYIESNKTHNLKLGGFIFPLFQDWDIR